MSNISTVTIVDKNKDGDFIIINKSDYDKSIHTLFNDKPKNKRKPKQKKAQITDIKIGD